LTLKNEKSDNMRKIKNSNNAVVGIVAAFLIVGLIVAVFSVIQLQYVPKWIEEKEADHLAEVAKQFTQLKYALDIQSIVNGTTAISTSISLGNKEIPFFNAGRTFDSLSTVSEGFKMIINYDTDAEAGTYSSKTYKTDVIKYSSNNYYFVNQDFIYEAGALILCQENENVLIGKPSILVTKPDRKNISILFVNVSGISGKTSSSGYGVYDIYTQSYNYDMNFIKFYNVSNITIVTDYVNAWNASIRRSFLQIGLHINYRVETFPNKLVIHFDKDTLGDYYYDIYVREVEIKAEIGYGLSNS
jgi:hypothetical protein